MPKPVIVAAMRTAIGTYGGALAQVPAVDLGKAVIAGVLRQTGVNPEIIDEVILGNVLQAGQGQNPARQAAVAAGIPFQVPAYTVNKVCGSGLKAIALGAQAIAAGEAEVVIAGGMESMSNAPYYLPKARFGCRMGHDNVLDGMIQDGLWCSFGNYHMGITAENIAVKYRISRHEQDEYALKSQERYGTAIKRGIFEQEIVPVTVPLKGGKTTSFFEDEHSRPDVTMEQLAKLKPAFKSEGSVTAGNASGLNDGAAAVMLMSRERACREGLKPLAELVASASAGVDPAYMGLGPAAAITKLLPKVGLKRQDIGLWELNEAFAVQSLAVVKALELNHDQVNVNGGAIALGHPIGASGARILVTLISEMQRRGASHGIAALCIGGGQGIAAALRNWE